MLIFEALDFPLPTFAHISLIFAPDHTKLSKRHGATSIGQFREMGFLPQALFNFLALLGWSPKDDREFFTKEELIQLFDLDAVNKAPAVFDIGKLKWMNHKYIVDTDTHKLCDEVLPYFAKAGLTNNCDEKTLMIVDTIKGNMDVIPDCVNIARPFFGEIGFPAGEEEQKMLLTQEAVSTFDYILANVEGLTFTKDDIENFLQNLKDVLGLPGKKLYHPIRVALFGSKSGPELWKIFLSLGKEKVSKRLESTLNEIKKRGLLI
jgi:nondiscriminating glutamyl-tRNA synthetase